MTVVTTPRYLCSHLVRLRVGDDPERWANLEEIWESGAVLECEEEVRVGAAVRIAADDVAFAGVVATREPHDFGWRVGIDFAPGMRWAPDLWMPGHALDPGALAD